MAKKAAQRNREHLVLLNGCTSTIPYISPSNWASGKTSIRKKWFVRFTFYDPVHRPKGKVIKWEKTINNFKSLVERQKEARKVLDQVVVDLKAGVNPVLGHSVPDQIKMDHHITHEFLTPQIPFKKAIEWAFDQFPANRTKTDMQTIYFHIIPALTLTKYEKIPIRDVTPQHIVLLLDACAKVKSRYDPKSKLQIPLSWSNYKHNKCLAYLSMMLNKVVALRVIAINPCHGIQKQTVLVKPKIALMPYELEAIDQKLKAKPNYRRFIQIFHASGSRITEMLKVQMKDVLLDQQCFYRWILKRKSKTIIQQRTTIPASVMHLWQEQLSMCKSPDDYLFGLKFRPGKKAIGHRSVQTYWSQLAQKPLGIKQGVYILKHHYLTQLKKMHGSQTAAGHAGHTSTSMVDSIYDLDRESSEHERIRSADISFVPSKRLSSSDKCKPMAFGSI